MGDMTALLANDGEMRLNAALEAAGMGTWEWDVASGVTVRNDQHARLFGVEPDELAETYEAFVERVHPEDLPSVEATLAEAVATGELFEGDYRIQWPDGTIRWLRHRGQARTDATGAQKVIGVVFDVTAERRAAERSRYLLRLGEALAGAMTPGEVARAVVSQAVPAVEAQAGAVVIVDESGNRLRTLAMTGYSDEDVAALADRELDTARRFPVSEAIATGWPVVLPNREVALDRYPMMLSLRPDYVTEGLLALPLVVPDRRLGALVLEYAEPLGDDANRLALAQTLAAVCAQALERARLYEVSVGVAETLQRQLLPTRLPDVEGADSCFRYLPATDDMLVGGDFYDVLPLSGGRTGLVLGDVMGKGIRAAAIMGQVRTVVATVARMSDDPAEVLTRTESLLRDIDVDAIVTCFYGVLDPVTRQLRYSNAGHLPLIIAERNGYRLLEDGSVDPPLGAPRDSERRASTVELNSDAVAVLCTDGLVEDRTRPVDVGLAELGAVMTAGVQSGAPLAELCETALSELLHGRRNDDVALMTLRLLPAAESPGA